MSCGTVSWLSNAIVNAAPPGTVTAVSTQLMSFAVTTASASGSPGASTLGAAPAPGGSSPGAPLGTAASPAELGRIPDENTTATATRSASAANVAFGQAGEPPMSRCPV